VINAVLLLTSGCGMTTTSASVAGSVAPSPTEVASTAPSATVTPAVSAPAPTPDASDAAFHVCPATTETPTCPLAVGAYSTATHDLVGFSIAEEGWQEEPTAAGEFETRVVVSRVEDPSQRLTFLSGPTGPATPVALDPSDFDADGFKAGQPVAVAIAGTAAQAIDVAPDGAQAPASVTIEGQYVPLEPDRRYRFTVAKIGMGEEAATVIMVTEAPAGAFDSFSQKADQVLESVTF
jgi:hypothetical protein